MRFILANALSFLCLITMIAAGLFMYSGLPESIPTQYSFTGIPGNYVPKQAAVLIMPLAYAATIAIIHFMIQFSPEKFAMPNSQRAMDIIVFSVGVLLLAAHLGILASQGDSGVFQQYFAVGFSCLLIIMGNVIGKTERNFIAGIRLPWTLASEKNWRATHRLAGRLMVLSGLLLFLTSFLWASLPLTLVVGLSWLIISSIYSFLFFLKNERSASE
ncbi:MAG: hypothetical protein DHS20C12_13280 [Pseudohongiella sp.]|nr:MAG: hypothetical protein DHS20C12_13280 [Pseudohongiella sp.]